MGLLEGKVAVVTGAGSGMGRASVQLFAAEGAKVVGGDISGAQDDTAAEAGDGVIGVHCDVTKEADIEAMVRTAVEEFGTLDVMCNVAGIAEGAKTADITQEHYDKQMNVDLFGVVFGMKHGIRAMREGGNGGSIVNWSSLGGLNGAGWTTVYNAAKHGVIGATKCAAIDYGPENIRVNAVTPGFIHSEIMGAAGENIPGITEKAVLKRGGQPIEVARVAAFLASDNASYVTGAVIPVDGGWGCRNA